MDDGGGAKGGVPLIFLDSDLSLRNCCMSMSSQTNRANIGLDCIHWPCFGTSHKVTLYYDDAVD